MQNVAEQAGNLNATGQGIDLLYIAAASRSGSTLLTFLLAAQPAVATVGELKGGIPIIEKYNCSCGERIHSCPFWRRLIEALAQQDVVFDLSRFGTHFRFETAGQVADRVVRAPLRGPLLEAGRSLALRMLPSAAREFGSILERNRLLIETICKLRGTRVFLDSSKEANRLKYMIGSGLWNVKAVHLVRDGRGVTHSLLRLALRKRPGNDRRTELRACARQWRRVNEACEQVLERLPRESVVRIRYEDLCREPEATLEPVLGLIGERPVKIPEDFRSIDHHIVGNMMRLREGRIRLDEKWHAGLNHEELAEFDRIAGDMNRRYGYV